MIPSISEAESQGRYHHPGAETHAVNILKILILTTGAKAAVEAGVVTKWLKDYPFTLRHPEKSKEDVIQDIIAGLGGETEYDTWLHMILWRIAVTKEGRRQMAEAGLGDHAPLERPEYFPTGSTRYHAEDIGTRATETLPDDLVEDTDFPTARAAFRNGTVAMDSDGDGVLVIEEVGGSNSGPRRRADTDSWIRWREESVEERSLRRRRREAMVYAEDGGPVGQENIIQQDTPVHPGAVRELLETFAESVERRQVDEPRAGESADSVSEADEERGWLAWLSGMSSG